MTQRFHKDADYLCVELRCFISRALLLPPASRTECRCVLRRHFR